MKRPLCIKHIDRHAAAGRITPFRLRTVEANLLLGYIEHLERNQRSAPAGGSEPEDRVLSDGRPCEECGTVGGHLDGCSR